MVSNLKNAKSLGVHNYVMKIIQHNFPQAHSDDRLKRSSEMLNGIKLLKLYGWEDIYLNLIKAIRTKELESIRKFNTQFGYTGT